MNYLFITNTTKCRHFYVLAFKKTLTLNINFLNLIFHQLIFFKIYFHKPILCIILYNMLVIRILAVLAFEGGLCIELQKVIPKSKVKLFFHLSFSIFLALFFQIQWLHRFSPLILLLFRLIKLKDLFHWL